MRIAFLTTFDPHDRRAWSGILYYMFRSLERHCGTVVSLGPAGQEYYFAGKVIRRGLRTLTRRNIDYARTVVFSKRLAALFDRRLSKERFDIIFAPVASNAMAFLQSSVPVVRYEDVTARVFRDYGGHLLGLSPWSLRQCELLESQALRRADQVVFASQWAARSAIEDYGAPESKINVIPMGANLDDVPSAQHIAAVRMQRSAGSCKLLFIGVDWERKGGDIALASLRELRGRGIEANLTVVGCTPRAGVSDPAMHVIPFLDKNLPDQRRRLDELLMDSDFLLFPSRREAYGVVCCEANAFGLPVIASNTGGIPVWNGENGVLLPADASGRDYADQIHALLTNREHYLALVRASRLMFETRLNWDSWGRSMSRVFDKAISKTVTDSARLAALSIDEPA